MKNWEDRAIQAGLTYITDFETGHSRRKCGRGFKFIDAGGKTIVCKDTRQRITSLVIPPAWKEVWICTDSEGHIQATGFDEAGRKQYIYHPRWHEASSAHKYGRLSHFANKLPAIRRSVSADLKRGDLDKRRVVAAVIRLMDKSCIRVGNKQYLEANDSRGATTLTSDHVCRHSKEITFNFRGKSGKQIELTCQDEQLAAVIEDCENSDGEFLFSYQNANDEFVPVTSSDVNSYLYEFSEESITAKDFRTWRGSVIALNKLADMPENISQTARKRLMAEAVRAAAGALANTPAVCRKSYIHSAILDMAAEGILPSVMRTITEVKAHRTGLTKAEIMLVKFLLYAEKFHDEKVKQNPDARKAAA
jgi:DNA topoisomerase I